MICFKTGSHFCWTCIYQRRYRIETLGKYLKVLRVNIIVDDQRQQVSFLKLVKTAFMVFDLDHTLLDQLRQSVE